MKQRADVFLWGALHGFFLALVYGYVYSLYAVIRSSGRISSILPIKEGLAGTLSANALSILVSGFVFALIFSLPALLVAGGTALLLHRLGPVYRVQNSPSRAISLGIVVAALLSAAISVVIRQLVIDYPAFFPGGYTAWIGIPCGIYIVLSAWMSWNLSKGKS